MKVFSFRNIRILFLLLLLAFVAIYTKQQRMYSTSWLEPLAVVIFPINADGSPQAAEYIASLNDDNFSAIDAFTAREAKRYGLYQEQPTITTLGPSVDHLPPPPPPQDASTLKIGLWSMQLRYWVWKHTPDGYSGSNTVRMFVLYHDPKSKRIPNSLGLEKGLLGVVHAFASSQQSKQNNIVIAHELMHTVGATDKYDAITNNPLFPDGYAQPERQPLHPQYRAEIMAGRIPQSESSSEMARSLDSCVIGSKTAREISWLDAQ